MEMLASQRGGWESARSSRCCLHFLSYFSDPFACSLLSSFPSCSHWLAPRNLLLFQLSREIFSLACSLFRGVVPAIIQNARARFSPCCLGLYLPPRGPHVPPSLPT